VDRILIKIAATWEGIQAAQVLEAEGIHCNLTLVFHFAQAVAAARAGVFLISPFVGRIYDWYVKQHQASYSGPEDPGVQSVHNIYHYFKAFNISTIVMGASFRSIGQIQALCGCDYLTISPDLLSQLHAAQGVLKPALTVAESLNMHIKPAFFDESSFRYAVNSDPMATEKLSEGIRLFARDSEKLEALLDLH
jgi:transaldolase